MLNRTLNKTIAFILILLFFLLKLKAGVNNVGDTLEASAFNFSASSPEIPLHPSMENFINEYSDDNDQLFENIKQDKSIYFRTIDKIFVQQNIPVELKYLAIVESKLKTNARSGVGAAGVWQFMPGTAKRFGLKITSKYDDRQNLWKSTVAAAKYLQNLYSYFGDWLLVIASYNSGPAPVLNAIKKSGSKNFWKLQYFLPKETRLHVKRFIATHYYFEGGGSLVTIGKAETEKYLKEMEDFKSKNNSDDNEDDKPVPGVFTQLVAVINQEKNLQLILKK